MLAFFFNIFWSALNISLANFDLFSCFFLTSEIFELFQSDEKKEEFACILSYISHLIAFWEKYRPTKSKHERNKTGEYRTAIPQIVYQKLMVLFMNSESNVLSTEKHELLIGYILVLTLFADNFQSEPTDIAKDLKMNWQRLKLYYLQLGCKAKEALVTLPVPLQFPDMKRRKKKQSRQ